MKVWNKLDKVMGAGILSGVAGYAIYMRFDGHLAAICAGGAITLLAASKRKGGEK